MRVSYDRRANAAYLSLVKVGPGEDARQEVTETGLILHFNKRGHLIGVETLKPAAHFPPELLATAERPNEDAPPQGGEPNRL